VQPLQQLTKEALGSALIPALLDKDIQHVSILIDRAPQIMALSVNCDKHFVEMPRVPQPPLAMPQLSRKLLTKLQTPLADRLIAHCDPTLGQQLFNG